MSELAQTSVSYKTYPLSNGSQQSAKLSTHIHHAEPKAVNDPSYFEAITQYLPAGLAELSSHVPQRVKDITGQLVGTNQPAQNGHGTSTRHDVSTWAGFDTVTLDSGEVIVTINVGYTNGFQVWNASDPKDIQELVSRRDGSVVKCMRFLQQPLLGPGVVLPDQAIQLQRPLLAIVSGDRIPSVKIYSLATHSYLFEMSFDTEVLDVATNRRVLLIATREHLFAFDNITLENTFRVATYTSPHELSAPLALGQRWLVYAGNESVPESSAPPHQTYADTIGTVAKDIASGLVYLGGMGVKTLENYWSPPDADAPVNPRASPKPTPDHGPHAGTVIVRDVVSRAVLAHFKAHNHPISALQLDASGTLLATVSVEGHYINVFRIFPRHATDISRNHQQLYRLARGLTDASVRNLAFSVDSKWLSASSTRGTTHVYAVSVEGGPVTARTHLPEQRASHAVVPSYVYNQLESVEVVEGSAVARMKQGVELSPTLSARQGVNADEHGYVISQFIRVGKEVHVIVLASDTLSQYRVRPFHQVIPDGAPDMFDVQIETVVSWRVSRPASWRECASPLLADEANARLNSGHRRANRNESETARWLSNAEPSTHAPGPHPLWANPRWSFHSYTTPVSHAQTGKKKAKRAQLIDLDDIPDGGPLMREKWATTVVPDAKVSSAPIPTGSRQTQNHGPYMYPRQGPEAETSGTAPLHSAVMSAIETPLASRKDIARSAALAEQMSAYHPAAFSAPSPPRASPASTNGNGNAWSNGMPSTTHDSSSATRYGHVSPAPSDSTPTDSDDTDRDLDDPKSSLPLVDDMSSSSEPPRPPPVQPRTTAKKKKKKKKR